MTNISKLTVFGGEVPNKKTQTDNQFAQNIYAFLHYNAGLVPDINTSINQINKLSGEMENMSAGMEESRDIILGSSNYQGDYSEDVEYEKTQSVTYNNLQWISKGDNNIGNIPSDESPYWYKNPISEQKLKDLESNLSSLNSTLEYKASLNHNHDTSYLGIDATAKNSSKLNGKSLDYFAEANHNHDASYLGIEATAKNSLLLEGLSKEVFLGKNKGTTTQNPNNATFPTILTMHNECPDSSHYWHIRTQFFDSISTTSNRAQIAIKYNGSPDTYVRTCYGGTWTQWIRIDNNGVPLPDVSLSDFNATQSTNGYQKLPGGMIFQWGLTTSSSTTIHFPIAFPRNCFVVVSTFYGSGGNSRNCKSKSKTSFTTPYGGGRMWYAIGN